MIVSKIIYNFENLLFLRATLKKREFLNITFEIRQLKRIENSITRKGQKKKRENREQKSQKYGKKEGSREMNTAGGGSL